MSRLQTRLWTSDSGVLLGGFLLVVLLIAYLWWPLALDYLAYVDWQGPWWLSLDWLLIGIFLIMTLTILAGADLRADVLIVFVGILGGLAIETWGTQTGLWFYYTGEQPPLWIIPAWPIASLSVDRITRALRRVTSPAMRLLPGESPRARSFEPEILFRAMYWVTFALFFALMMLFVFPTLRRSFTILAVMICLIAILTPTDHRYAVLTFAAGAGLGYFL